MTRAAVIGCGIMGSGITFVARAAGFPVTAVEPTDDLVAAARDRVEGTRRRPASGARTSRVWRRWS